MVSLVCGGKPMGGSGERGVGGCGVFCQSHIPVFVVKSDNV